MSKFSRKGVSRRPLKVGETIRHMLSMLMQKEEIRDTALQDARISIAEVAMSPDLRFADTYVIVSPDVDAVSVIDILNKNAKVIRGKLSPQLKQMRYIPQFRFFEDCSIKNYEKISALLKLNQVHCDLETDE